jgi:DNA repair ATPase RecN
MAASMNIVANIDGKKTEVNQLIELMRAELSRVKADLKDELDKVNADPERLRAFNGSHR